MEQQNKPLSEEQDIDEAAHKQLKDEENKPITPPSQADIITEEHDLDEESHRQLEEEQ